jgi:rod shape-determining protein MreD
MGLSIGICRTRTSSCTYSDIESTRTDVNVAFWQRIDQSARSVTPFLLSLALVVLSVVPMPLPGFAPVVPTFAMMSIYHWAIYRPNLMPLSAVFVIGVLYDLLTGAPAGLSAVVFLTVYGVALTQRRFIAGKSFLIYWFGFAIVALGAAVEGWLLVSLWDLTLLDFRAVWFQYLVSIGVFPLIAWIFMKWQQSLLFEH